MNFMTALVSVLLKNKPNGPNGHSREQELLQYIGTIFIYSCIIKIPLFLGYYRYDGLPIKQRNFW